MQLLPSNTLRRRIFEACDRWLCHALTNSSVTCSTYLGDRLQAGTAQWYQRWLASQIDAMTFEYMHCWKNAGKP